MESDNKVYSPDSQALSIYKRCMYYTLGSKEVTYSVIVSKWPWLAKTINVWYDMYDSVS